MNLLWIDDDAPWLALQVGQLVEAGYNVQVVTEVDVAWNEWIYNRRSQEMGLILDIAMGTGNLLKSVDTNGGLRTGEKLLAKMAAEGLLVKEKTMVYTIVSNTETQKYVQDLGVEFYRKQAYPGIKIVGLVKEVFGEP